MKKGRPSKYKPRYCKEIIAFFSVEKNRQYVKSEKITTKSNGTQEVFREYAYIANDLPTFARFARQIKVNGDTIVEWAEKKKDFSAAYNQAKELQKEFLSDNALKGLHPPSSFIFIAKNITDWKDKNETEHSGSVVVIEEQPK